MPWILQGALWLRRTLPPQHPSAQPCLRQQGRGARSLRVEVGGHPPWCPSQLLLQEAGRKPAGWPAKESFSRWYFSTWSTAALLKIVIDQTGPPMLAFCLPSTVKSPNPELGVDLNTDPMARFSYAKSPLLLFWNLLRLYPRQQSSLGERRGTAEHCCWHYGDEEARGMDTLCPHCFSASERNYLMGAAFYKVCASGKSDVETFGF